MVGGPVLLLSKKSKQVFLHQKGPEEAAYTPEAFEEGGRWEAGFMIYCAVSIMKNNLCRLLSLLVAT